MRALVPLLLLALTVPSQPADAADADLKSGLIACRSITDNLARLTCYDNLAKKAETATATPSGILPAYGGSASSPAPRAPVSSRCQATTKKGTQCSRNARAGSNYCWQHGR